MKEKLKLGGSVAAVIITIFTLCNTRSIEIYETPEPPEIKVETYEPSRSGYINMKNFSVPVNGTLTSDYGTRWGKMHNGIDIGAPSGTIIYSAASGTVTFSGWQDGYGNVIIINHGNNIETVYAHCSKSYVKKSQNIASGEKIGEVGSTGKSTGPHVHFEIRVDGKAKDPKAYVKQI